MLITTPQDIITCARTFIGTQFGHQGRIKHDPNICIRHPQTNDWIHYCTIDCVGLLICIGKELGISSFDFLSYDPHPDGETLERLLGENLDRLDDWRDAEEGDALVMHYGSLRPQHVLIVSKKEAAIDQSTYVIHASSIVMEHHLDAWFLDRIHSAYRARLD